MLANPHPGSEVNVQPIRSSRTRHVPAGCLTCGDVTTQVARDAVRRGGLQFPVSSFQFPPKQNRNKALGDRNRGSFGTERTCADTDKSPDLAPAHSSVKPSNGRGHDVSGPLRSRSSGCVGPSGRGWIPPTCWTAAEAPALTFPRCGLPGCGHASSHALLFFIHPPEAPETPSGRSSEVQMTRQVLKVPNITQLFWF